ncbi:MAG TPA: alpha-L-fucosidase [Bacteroidales bacterium]|nr:alpha-L-fucosidase [Bacteroidales bacterium]
MKISSSTLLASLLVTIIFTGCTEVVPPAPFGALPSDRQLQWHRMKYYAFIHFSPNTFTDKEWGFGDEPESIFNPTELDCRQWTRVVKEAGMEGIIITAKHHDGFCLWPSAYTEHSVKNSLWREGEGDLLKELREACDESGLKMGIYLSPWDRNHAAYGTDEYITYYRSQLTELTTLYGEIFEVWFDGANGGDGYYGGANETRRIDNKTYYDWENTISIVREHQPMAVIFSDGGPDIRWIGNERGYAAETNWCTIRGGIFYPGVGGVNKQLQEGHEDGDIWLPAEVNTSIRPGWFYHPNEDDKVKSVEQLIDNWYHSVGMNGNFLLNLPVDRRGLVHENDIKALQALKEYINAAFSVDYSREAKASASNIRGNSKIYGASNVIDDDPESYWATDDDVRDASITISFQKPTRMNAILLQEYIRLGQRVKSFKIEAFQDGGYKEIADGITIGNRRIVKFPLVETTELRINIIGKAALLISNFEIYLAPELN